MLNNPYCIGKEIPLKFMGGAIFQDNVPGKCAMD